MWKGCGTTGGPSYALPQDFDSTHGPWAASAAWRWVIICCPHAARPCHTHYYYLLYSITVCFILMCFSPLVQLDPDMPGLRSCRCSETCGQRMADFSWKSKRQWVFNPFISLGAKRVKLVIDEAFLATIVHACSSLFLSFQHRILTSAIHDKIR